MELYKIAAANLKGIGKKYLLKLLKNDKGLHGIFESDISLLAEETGFTKEYLQKMNRGLALKKAEKQLLFNQRSGITTLFITDDEYPDLLKGCPDAPIILFFKGNPLSLTKTAVSIVGTRNATVYGKTVLNELISKFARHDVLIVSGLAYGIDTLVHRACLEYGVSTMGVLAHGLNRIYPYANRILAKEMCTNGGLLTESCIHEEMSKYSFPRRNRIIAGLSQATIVVESAKKGGAMITAELANGYHREVMAYPGSALSAYSKGCHHLIQTQQAHLISEAEDIFKLMEWPSEHTPSRPAICLSTEESEVIGLLKRAEFTHFDTLLSEAKFSVSDLQSIMLDLELKDIVHSLPGSLFKLNLRTALPDRV